jgi:arsenate reductase
MSSSVKILHNPRCSKSRQTMQVLESKGFTPDIIEYLKAPPSYAELDEILQLLDLGPRELMRTHEKPYKENGLDNPELSREQLITAMVANPILIERPIVIHAGRAKIGRPPESVLDIL